jgi:hypothetical protein
MNSKYDILMEKQTPPPLPKLKARITTLTINQPAISMLALVILICTLFYLFVFIKTPVTYFDGQSIIYVDRWTQEIIKVEPVIDGIIREL